jgi:hypothetical protein
MKPILFLRCLVVGCLFFVLSLNSSAQIKRIAILSFEDTLTVHRHVGLTLFANFTDTLNLNIAVTKYFEKRLFTYLSPNYKVSIIHLPDSITRITDGLYGAWGVHKLVKKWIGNSKDKYDLIIFVINYQIPREWNLLVPDRSSGIYSKLGKVGFYSTISFLSFYTSNLAKLEYYPTAGSMIVTPFENFELPKDKRSFTPEMITSIREGLINHFDYRIGDFLTSTFLVDIKTINRIKANTTH